MQCLFITAAWDIKQLQAIKENKACFALRKKKFKN
jgi:hypothetical protein